MQKKKKRKLKKIFIRKTIALNMGMVFALGQFAKVEQIWQLGLNLKVPQHMKNNSDHGLMCNY